MATWSHTLKAGSFCSQPGQPFLHTRIASPTAAFDALKTSQTVLFPENLTEEGKNSPSGPTVVACFGNVWLLAFQGSASPSQSFTLLKQPDLLGVLRKFDVDLCGATPSHQLIPSLDKRFAPFVASLFLVAMPGAPSSFLVPGSKARSP